MTGDRDDADDERQAAFLGLRFSSLDLDGVLALITRRPADAPFAYVVTPNVDHVVRLHRGRSDLWPAYRGAWLTLCDSRILRGLGHLAGVSLPVTAGSDLTAALFDGVIGPADRVAVLGGTAGQIAALKHRFGLHDVAHHSPPRNFVADPAQVTAAVAFLRTAQARYSIIAVGSPQQELVARQLARGGGGQGLGFCIGAGLDFLTGAQRRAPRVMQRLSLEWLFRLLSSPGTMWRRYLRDGPRIVGVYRTWSRLPR